MAAKDTAINNGKELESVLRWVMQLGGIKDEWETKDSLLNKEDIFKILALGGIQVNKDRHGHCNLA